MLAPQRFGRYLLTERIATGGMAEIFKAKLVGVMGFEKTVVIKRILPFWSGRRDFVTMLVDEAKILVHLNHPNIVQVFELGCEEETYYIAMEYVEGIDLRGLISRCRAVDRKLPQDIALYVILESLAGLSYAHERSLKDRGPLQIVHRDVSPQNILLSFDGEVKVTDFGIAKALIKTHETQTGTLKGKFAYMSPEQAVGAALDGRSDIFSTGIVLYELLFHQRLFAGSTDIETLDRVRQSVIPWPEAGLKEIYPGLQDVLAKNLSREAGQRYASASEFAAALRACIPSGKTLDRWTLKNFLSELYPREIEDRRKKEEQEAQQTEGFLRRTQVSPDPDEDTVSLVETETEMEGGVRREAEADFTRTKGARPRMSRAWFAWGGVFLVFAAAAYLGIQNIGRESPRSPPPPAPVLQVAPAVSSPPTAALIPTGPLAAQATPSPPALPLLLGTLALKAQPAGAKIVARYADVRKEGTGTLRVEGVPSGSQVKVRVDLAKYEGESRNFDISPERLNQDFVFSLRKKPLANGSLRIVVAPWGRVNVQGLGSAPETPKTWGAVPEGSYSVTVTSNSGKRLSARAVVRPGILTNCTGDFNRSTFSCR